VGVSALGYPSGLAGPSEISVYSDVQVSPYSLAIGIADTRTHLEATPTPSTSLRQPPVAATETAAAQGLTHLLVNQTGLSFLVPETFFGTLAQ